eukprot:2694888-Prymnesium_polylepis.1
MSEAMKKGAPKPAYLKSLPSTIHATTYAHVRRGTARANAFACPHAPATAASVCCLAARSRACAAPAAASLRWLEYRRPHATSSTGAS